MTIWRRPAISGPTLTPRIDLNQQGQAALSHLSPFPSPVDPHTHEVNANPARRDATPQLAPISMPSACSIAHQRLPAGPGRNRRAVVRLARRPRCGRESAYGRRPGRDDLRRDRKAGRGRTLGRGRRAGSRRGQLAGRERLDRAVAGAAVRGGERPASMHAVVGAHPSKGVCGGAGAVRETPEPAGRSPRGTGTPRRARRRDRGRAGCRGAAG
jgi:hypothetical protein